MKILVTGGFGFLGSHLVELLLADQENQVHVVDNLSSNPLPLDFLLGEIGPPANLSYEVADVANFARGDPGVFDQIFHLASVVGPAGVIPHTGRIAMSILSDSLAMADVAMRTGAVLVDISTSEVYGGGQEGLCSEGMDRIVRAGASARLEYAVGKLAAETALLNLNATQELDVRIVRPFNITGPRQSGEGGFVLPRFIGQALAGVELTVFGDGRQVRAFTHVADMAEGIRLVGAKGQRGVSYNVGNPDNRCSILELASEVISLTESPSRIEFVDPKSIYGPFYEEANDKFPDARKAMEELGWKPMFGRLETIEDLYVYMRELPEELLVKLRGF